MKTVKLIINGKVKGVSFRRFARIEASNFKLNGYARNLENESLEIVLQGESENIDKFKGRANIGPPLSNITSIQEEILDNSVTFTEFNIL